METPNGKLRISVLAAAVQGALLAMVAVGVQAQEATVEDYTLPDNFVEFGALNVSKTAPKFGEYTGENKSGAYAIGNFSVKGGDGYGEAGGLTRWSVSGSNLGLDSREVKAGVSKQGQWNLGVGYDELKHSTTTGYQTPYNGSMGGNNFALPAGFGTAANTTTLTAGQQAAFHTVDVDNTRRNTSFTAGYVFSPQWRVTFDYNNLEQSGAKLMAFASDPNLGGGVTGERSAILPNPTNYTTNTFNLAVDWTGKNGHLMAGYYGSLFTDHYDRVNWTTFAGANATDTMTTPPSNEFHQINLSGNYRFSPQTQFAGGLSYGRNTQDSAYVANPAALISIPQSALNGLVVTTHGDAKVTHEATKDLRLTAGVTYNERDNKTQSGIYEYMALNTTNPANAYAIPNPPYSWDKTQAELAADYRLNRQNRFRFAYDRDEMKRRCNSYGASAEFPAGTNCVVDTKTTEDKLTLGYKLRMLETGTDFRLGYVYSDRKTDYDSNAQVPLDSVRGGTNLLTGVQGTIVGLNGGDYQGFHPYFDASRTQNLLKAGVNWQATDKVSLDLGGRYAKDDYKDAAFGIQDGKSWSWNLNLNYVYSDNGEVYGFVSQDYRERSVNHVNRSNTTSNAYIWSDRLKDDGIDYGVGFKQGGLMHGKLDLKGDLTYSEGKSNYSSALLYTYPGGTTTATTCAAATTLTCGSAPDILNKLTQFRLIGTYKIDKKNKVALGYIYQKLASTDYFYNAYQYGYTATSVLPTNQQPGSYSVNVVAASYIYSFR